MDGPVLRLLTLPAALPISDCFFTISSAKRSVEDLISLHSVHVEFASTARMVCCIASVLDDLTVLLPQTSESPVCA